MMVKTPISSSFPGNTLVRKLFLILQVKKGLASEISKIINNYNCNFVVIRNNGKLLKCEIITKTWNDEAFTI